MIVFEDNFIWIIDFHIKCRANSNVCCVEQSSFKQKTMVLHKRSTKSIEEIIVISRKHNLLGKMAVLHRSKCPGTRCKISRDIYWQNGQALTRCKISGDHDKTLYARSLHTTFRQVGKFWGFSWFFSKSLVLWGLCQDPLCSPVSVKAPCPLPGLPLFPSSPLSSPVPLCLPQGPSVCPQFPLVLILESCKQEFVFCRAWWYVCRHAVIAYSDASRSLFAKFLVSLDCTCLMRRDAHLRFSFWLVIVEYNFFQVMHGPSPSSCFVWMRLFVNLNRIFFCAALWRGRNVLPHKQFWSQPQSVLEKDGSFRQWDF